LSLVLAVTRDLRDGGKAAEEVRISLSPSFGARWLMPRLGRFRAMHPNIRVVTVADNRLANLDVEHFDFAVRYTTRPDVALEAAFMMDEDLCAVAAPELLAGLSPVPEALVSLPFLHDKSEEGWRAWLAAVGRPNLQPSKGIVFNDYNLTIEAAAAGLGVAIGRTALIAEELRTGRLSEVGPFRVSSVRAYYLVRPRRSALPAAQILWDWLLNEGLTHNNMRHGENKFNSNR
jgi:LysR family glycine cleavage system transcriptional activator